ncbi:hypothetical protein VHEMI03308 [[Torrubiella] hemipterigena]|uniref:Uncharacterized protein n=1 Tax=[Torrubiella] hemipterigena TaxID=1531966 RepID=A0A0A1SY52_9HYPO|nr:hypothetical protein VHEMI03308 [[Torrubiella] hemipterigena]
MGLPIPRLRRRGRVRQYPPTHWRTIYKLICGIMSINKMKPVLLRRGTLYGKNLLNICEKELALNFPGDVCGNSLLKTCKKELAPNLPGDKYQEDEYGFLIIRERITAHLNYHMLFMYCQRRLHHLFDFVFYHRYNIYQSDPEVVSQYQHWDLRTPIVSKNDIKRRVHYRAIYAVNDEYTWINYFISNSWSQIYKDLCGETFNNRRPLTRFMNSLHQHKGVFQWQNVLAGMSYISDGPPWPNRVLPHLIQSGDWQTMLKILEVDLRYCKYWADRRLLGYDNTRRRIEHLYSRCKASVARENRIAAYSKSKSSAGLKPDSESELNIDADPESELNIDVKLTVENDKETQC